jgi:SSS family transporter
MRALDLAVILGYLVLIGAIGLRLSGRQRDATDYFVGERDLPWPVVAFSIVATETSTLTVISVPGVAYLGAFSYVELALGYLLGRVLVAAVLLPRYFTGDLVSAYQYLAQRFGVPVQRLAAVTFMVTRLLAEGVRLFASAIPIRLLLEQMGVRAGYPLIITVITLVTVGYTYAGGIKAVIWTDAIQMLLYTGGAAVCVGVLLGRTGLGGLGAAAHAGKFHLFQTHAPILTSPYAVPTAIVGGAVFTMASHGADQLIVQRVLTCRSLAAGRRAMIGSALGVIVLFALFSLVGALLFVFRHGRSPAALGLDSSDQIFPQFILDGLPVGLSGLLVAGILGATMGSLSSALNSLSTSTIADLGGSRLRGLDGRARLRLARLATLGWAGAMVAFAVSLSSTRDPVIVLGLSITGYTYGALLGAFLLGLLVRRAQARDAMVAFLVTVALMAVIVLAVHVQGLPLAFPWYVPLGVAITLSVGATLSRCHGRPESPPSTAVMVSPNEIRSGEPEQS